MVERRETTPEEAEQTPEEAEQTRETAFLDAFERRETERVGSDFALAFDRAGLDPAAREAKRVDQMLTRDQRDRAAEEARRVARIQVANGEFANLADTVLPPPPEWLAKHDVRTFRPRQPDGTVRELKTVRRVLTPVVVRMHQAGKISDEQARACLWYSYTHEIAGLEGRYSSSRYNAAASFGASKDRCNGGAAGHIAMTLHEANARREFRDARKAIAPRYLKFFEAVVLNELPLGRAIRFARCRNERALLRFREVVNRLVAHCELARIDFKGIERGQTPC